MPTATQISLIPRNLLTENGTVLSDDDIELAEKLINENSEENEGYRLAQKESGLGYTVIRFPNDSTLYAIFTSKPTKGGQFIAGGYGEIRCIQNLETGELSVLKIARMESSEKRGHKFENRPDEALMENENKILLHLGMGLGGFIRTDTKDGKEKKEYLLGMKLVKGVDLARFLDNCSVSPYKLFHLVVCSLEALQRLHERGVEHKDFYANNLMYDEKEDKISIIDFGLSNKLQELNSGEDLLQKSDFYEFFASLRDIWPKALSEDEQSKINDFFRSLFFGSNGLKELIEFFKTMKAQCEIKLNDVVKNVEIVDADAFKTQPPSDEDIKEIDEYNKKLDEDIKEIIKNKNINSIQLISQENQLNLQKIASIKREFEKNGIPVEEVVVHNELGQNRSIEEIAKATPKIIRELGIEKTLLQTYTFDGQSIGALQSKEIDLINLVIQGKALRPNLSDEEKTIVQQAKTILNELRPPKSHTEGLSNTEELLSKSIFFEPAGKQAEKKEQAQDQTQKEDQAQQENTAQQTNKNRSQGL